MGRQLHLNVFLAGTGHHEASWIFEKTQPERISDFDYYKEIAAIAERGKFDSLFMGDHPALGRNVKYNAQGRLEPFTLLSALSVTTSHIGLIATASTTYMEPYNLARQFASLDHISKGRAGWNIVTTWNPEVTANFGANGRVSHEDRYKRAHEYLEVVTKLWDSWEDNARLIDRKSGIYADTARIHPINHHGTEFDVSGALDLPRSPQGRPVLVQAGSSEDGRAFAAGSAEAIFTAQQDINEAQAFYRDVKGRAKALGRDPNDITILPGLSPILGSTDAEAKALEDKLNDLIIPEVGLKHLSQRFDNLDLSGLTFDEPIPLDAFPNPDELQGAQSRAGIILGIIQREKGITLRQLLRRLAGGRGHRVLAGSPETVADHIVHWYQNGAADGFNIMPPYLPGGLGDFVEQVVPILQKRGLFRTDYTGTTLRDHYGLTRPVSQYEAA